ncbi:alpha/beta hydrolase [Chlorogloeopsis sp. ULAP01]|uniref:alpha/beta fold hydrolase n=1 Tax=Chlorogloeopsis sp. ULAP01 TaxID=3056483 RepID=UPI0025AB10A6|nr:alpha/beta hydrolase [Chlorogloeopsis sp. ULAP01]MDM9382540.1 alpha/beta hydrolase [Chlorogloeopsis sp. ULAP01]
MNLRKGRLESQYTNVDGLWMHSRVSVDVLPQDAPVVILVHGVVVSSRYMIPTAELLAPYYRVYAPDFPGYGESDKPKHVLELPELADTLCRWMDAVRIERATMLGNSFGCQIIAEFAMRHSDRLERAVLQGPTIDRHARNLPQQLWRFILNSPLEDPSQTPIQIYDYWLAGLPRFARTVQIALTDRIETKLPYLRVPTLVVRGKEDPVVSQEWTEEVVNLLPDARLVVIPSGGHTLNYSKPLELSRVTRAFIDATEKKERFNANTLV